MHTPTPGASFKLRLPATSANLGCGYDCLGLALDLHMELEAKVLKTTESSRVLGCPKEYSGQDNLILTSYRKSCSDMGVQASSLELKIGSSIPQSGGLGSSAACIVGGVLLAHTLHCEDMDADKIFQEACLIEGHPDNVAPCLFGGIVCSYPSVLHKGSFSYLKSEVSNNFGFVVLCPPYNVSTQEARKLMPKNISVPTSVWQSARTLVTFEALRRGDALQLKEATVDKLHEPVRKQLIPDYDRLALLAKDQGATSWLISGSGATMLAICDSSLVSQLVKTFQDSCENSWYIAAHKALNNGAVIEQLNKGAAF